MASFNSALFLTLLVAISTFMAAPSSVEAQLPSLLPNVIRINGTVICLLNSTLSGNNGNVSANGTVSNGTVSGNTNVSATNPPFANALVELRCGNATVASTRTNASGAFSFIITLGRTILSIVLSLLSGGGIRCEVVVPTPLSQCNSSLPTNGSLVGILTPVQGVVGGVVGGALGGILDLVIPIFQFLAGGV